MRIPNVFCCFALMLALLPSAFSAQANAVGSWKAVFVGPMGPRPKMVKAVTFSIKASADGFTLTARTEPGWPGELDVSDVKLEGDRLSFTGTGKTGWTESGQPHCCPKLMFVGTIKGDEMKLKMTWTSTEGTGRSAQELPMEAKKLPEVPTSR
jgi:hypothetical protein